MIPLVIVNVGSNKNGIARLILNIKTKVIVSLHGQDVGIQSWTVVSPPEDAVSVSPRPDPALDGQGVGQHISRLVGNLDSGVSAVGKIIRVTGKRLSALPVCISDILCDPVVPHYAV